MRDATYNEYQLAEAISEQKVILDEYRPIAAQIDFLGPDSNVEHTAVIALADAHLKVRYWANQVVRERNKEREEQSLKAGDRVIVEAGNGKTIRRNRIRCLTCNEEVESLYMLPDQIMWCRCRAVGVAGGTDYIRYLGSPQDIQNLSEVEEDAP